MSRHWAYGTLVGLGMCWGLTIPLTKIAVSTGHHPLGLVAMQSLLMTLLLGAAIVARGGRFRVEPRVLSLFLIIALSGSLVPGLFSFTASARLPAGVMAIVIALVPMFSLPIALLLGLERPSLRRMGGVLLGAAAVVLLVGPEASLPGAGAAWFVLVALIAPACYGFEGNYLALRGTQGLDPVQVLWGASVVSALLSVPSAAAAGLWVTPDEGLGWPETAIGLVALANCAAYVGYIWLVGKAGAVFASQVAYLVTASGVVWSMLLLSERYSGWIWMALGLMLTGLALVRPAKADQAAARKAA